VHDRFGAHGARLHALARGADSQPIAPRPPDPQLSREVAFDEPLAQAEQVAFAVRRTADAVVLALADVSAVCTEVRIDLTDDDGRVSSRTWLHPTCFEAADLVDRVRWQLEALAEAEADDVDAVRRGIVGVRIVPTGIDDAAHHQPALFGGAGDERLHHVLSRVQTIVGHRGVLTPTLSGGRWLSDRQMRTPWGERPVVSRDPALPWPGSLPGPYPPEVFDPPRTIRVRAADDADIGVDDRGALSCPPAWVEGAAVIGWAGPWPVREHRWDGGRAGHRFQLLDEHQRAWLVVLADGEWRAEGRYR
ncbi:MAG: DNA polymerase Y family protein, partial [Microbacterium sp.]